VREGTEMAKRRYEIQWKRHGGRWRQNFVHTNRKDALKHFESRKAQRMWPRMKWRILVWEVVEVIE
jgi:hypothetical protein